MAQYLGHYEIVRELGSGHFGTVYLADGEVPGKGVSGPRRRLVAIKRLRNPADPSAFETLQREFDLLEQVKHRSLCKVYEFLEDDRAVVMEHVHGVTLREVLDACTAAREKVFVEAAIEIGCEVADCLYQAYATPGRNGEPLQLVHRDLKPENVMITPSGEVKVLDFGLARVDPTHRADDRRIKGTPLYMAPEQALGKVVDHRTDLFALGLVLFELLMERPAYQVPDSGRDPVGDVMRRIEKADLDKEIHDVESRLPGPGPVVARCLQANQRARYQNGHELMLDLRRQLLKDRGAYLREFCDYFFHNIRPLEPVASGPEPGAPGKVRGSGAPTRPTTPDQGRAEPMANNPTPPRPGAPPRPGMPGSPPRPAAGPPRPGGPPGAPPGIAPPGPPAGAAPPAARPPAAPARPVPQGGKGVFTPSGGRSAATGLSDTPMAPRKRKKEKNAKSPDETGMLQMHALKDDDDDEADLTGAQPSSATQFFAIPATKKKSRGDDAPAPTGGGPAKIEATSGRALPGAASASLAPLPGLPPPGSPGSMPPMAMAGMGSMAPGMGAPMAIQGPVAAGPMAGAPPGMAPPPGGTPFAVGGPQPMGGVPVEENRAQSYRVFAIVLALVGIAMMVTVLAVVAILVGLNMGGEEPKEEVAKIVETPSRPSKPIRDTGEEEKAPEIPKTPKKTSSGPKTPPPPKEPPPPPPPALAPITITVPASEPFTSIEIKCSSIRERANFSGGKATVQNVPTNEDCQAFFKGGAPANFRPVRGGMTLSCTFVGSTAVCK